jgi:hypothetical protein
MLKKAPFDAKTRPKRREEWLRKQIKQRALEIVPNTEIKVFIGTVDTLS